MNWYYVENGKQAGPVIQEQFDALCQSGAITDQTLVWREGMPDWKPWGAIRVAGAPPVFGKAGGVVCASCGNSFRPEEVIRIHDRFVCAACKPSYLQRVREGVIGSAGGGLGRSGSSITEEELVLRDYQVDLGTTIERAWRALWANAGVMIGATVLFGLCFVAGWFVSVLLGFVLPFVNGLVLSALGGIISGGMTRLCLASQRGEPVDITLAFSVFGPQALQLALNSVVQAAIGMVFYIPMLVLMAGAGLLSGMNRGAAQFQKFDNMEIGMVLMLAGFGLLAMLAWTLLSTLWIFSTALIVDKGYNFWPAMKLSTRLVRKHFWMSLLFVILLGVVFVLGYLCCCIGLLVAFPLFMGMKAALYDMNFRDLAPQR